jgi:hypothetical protein
MRYWGLYSERYGWWIETAVSNYDEHVDRIVFYPLRSIAEAHLSQVSKIGNTQYAAEW